MHARIKKPSIVIGLSVSKASADMIARD